MGLLEILGGAAPQVEGALTMGLGLRDRLLDRQRQAAIDAMDRQRAEQQFNHANSQEARAAQGAERQIANEDINYMTNQGQAMVKNHRYDDAANLVNGPLSQALQRRGLPGGAPVMGGTKQIEAPRPAPGFQGPMQPVTAPDFNNPQTKSLLRSRLGIEPQAPQLTKVGNTVGSYDPESGDFKVLYTEPETMSDYQAESLKLRKELADDSLDLRRTVHADAQARGGSGGRGRTRTKTVNVGGRLILIDSDNGNELRDLGPAGSGGSDEFDDAKEGAKVRAKMGLSPGGLPPKDRQAYLAELATRRKAHATKSAPPKPAVAPVRPSPFNRRPAGAPNAPIKGKDGKPISALPAEMSPRMAAFYAKYDLTPGGGYA